MVCVVIWFCLRPGVLLLGLPDALVCYIVYCGHGLCVCCGWLLFDLLLFCYWGVAGLFGFAVFMLVNWLIGSSFVVCLVFWLIVLIVWFFDLHVV